MHSLRLLLVCALGHAALADEPENNEHYKAGSRKYAVGLYSEAGTEFEKSFEEHPTATALYNAAQMHRLAGNQKHAVELYRHYLLLYGDKATNREEVEQHIDDLQRAINSDVHAATAPPSAPAQPELAPPVAPPVPPSVEPAATVPPAAIVAPQEPPPAKSAPPRSTNVKWVVIGVIGAVVIAGAITAIAIASSGPELGTFSSGLK